MLFKQLDLAFLNAMRLVVLPEAAVKVLHEYNPLPFRFIHFLDCHVSDFNCQLLADFV